MSCTVSFVTLLKCYCLLLLCLIPLLHFITFRDCMAFHLFLSIISVAFIASFVRIFYSVFYCLTLFLEYVKIVTLFLFFFWLCYGDSAGSLVQLLILNFLERHSQDNVIFLHTNVCQRSYRGVFHKFCVL